MSRSIYAAMLFCVACALFGAAPEAKSPPAAPPACLMATASAAVQASACSECTNTCKSKMDKCKEGSVKACYEAAACLCQCNLDAGGCGSSTEALRKCVADNKKLAKEMEGQE
jgi:hypothetical protein